MADENAIRDVSDTALWVAMYRAQESERPDALFYDPYARQLAGERGEKILQGIRMPGWPIVVRTQVLDELILKAVEEDGYDTVLNLAAGLDTRPYRLALPTALRWVEADLAPIIEYKKQMLRDAKCFCRLERHAVDLADPAARRALFTKVGAAAQKVLVVTEGLLIYLEPEEVKALAADLHQPAAFKCWLLDIASPELLKMLARQGTTRADHSLPGSAQVQFKFAPAEHLAFFEPLGWKAAGYRSLMADARRLDRFEIPRHFKLLGSLMHFLVPGYARRMRELSGIGILEKA